MTTGQGESEFGVLLQQFRAAAGLSQDALAERAGLSRRGISDLERGARRTPYLTTVQRLAEAMALRPSDRLALIRMSRRGHTVPSTNVIADTEWSSLLQIYYARRADGARTAYGVTGQGPVLLMPPGLISHLQWWQTAPRIAAYLRSVAQHRTLVLYDRHGCGLSDRNRTNFTPEDDMLDIVAVADAVAPGAFDILGDSWGSQPAIMYAVRHPQRVRRLVLTAPAVRFSRGSTGLAHPNHGTTDDFVAERRAALAALRRADLELYVRTIGLMFFPSAPDEEAFWSFVRIHRMAATLEMQEALETVRFDVQQLLEKVTCPTLVIHRRGDLVCPFEIGQEVARRINGACLLPLDGDSHFPCVDDWRPMANAIIDFLARVSDGDANPAGGDANAVSAAKA